MNTAATVTLLKDNTANPAPLGLLGFGMTTVPLNIANAGFIQLNSMILAMGIFVGGIAQVIAGVQEWKKNNTFGATAFTAYGMFWLTLVGIVLIPKTTFGAAFAPDATSMGVFLFMWGLFTLFMLVGTLKLNRMLQAVFFTLTILFFLLAISEFTASVPLKTFAGYEGIICGLSACYGSAALVLNEVYGKTVLPLGAIERKSAAEPLPSLTTA
ncbi:MAG TPA: acetate uptake transporter [Chitinophagaceae bacterium]